MVMVVVVVVVRVRIIGVGFPSVGASYDTSTSKSHESL